MQVTMWLALGAAAVGCGVEAVERELPANAARPTTRLKFEVDFDKATIAFYDRSRRHNPRIKLDDRPCAAAGEEWIEAEDAVVEAFERGRRTAEDLKDWRSLDRFVIVREAAPEWDDAFHQLAKLRAQDRRLVFAGIRVTSLAGYLVFTGPDGMQAYCFAIERTGDRVVMPPRLVDMIEH